MRLLVTGGSGFIGSNFILYMLQKYPTYSIVNLDALTYAAKGNNLEKLSKVSRYRFVHGSICDAVLVEKTMSSCDAVVHFAAESHVDRSIENAEAFIMTNVVGTHVLLEAARKKKMRFHHISTDEVFGSILQGKFSEKTPYDPHSPYSASKAASDHLVRAYFHTHHLPITITNCSNNYGPYQHPEKLIPLFITHLMEGKKVPLYGDGLNIRDWLYVEDHCEAIDLVLHKGSIGETYCIGGESEKTNLEITKLLLSSFGKDETSVLKVPDRKGHDRRYAIDTAKIKRELGWIPKYNFLEGISKTIQWYKDHNSWWRNLK